MRGRPPQLPPSLQPHFLPSRSPHWYPVHSSSSRSSFLRSVAQDLAGLIDIQPEGGLLFWRVWGVCSCCAGEKGIFFLIICSDSSLLVSLAYTAVTLMVNNSILIPLPNYLYLCI